MAKTDFRAVTDGEGRVRFFVDGASHSLDEYVAKYLKVYGTMPVIPVGPGGAAAPAAPPEPVVDEVAELRARLAELEAKLSNAIERPDAPAEPEKTDVVSGDASAAPAEVGEAAGPASGS